MRALRAMRFWPILGACALALACSAARAAEEPPHSAELDAMIVKAAQRHGVPEALVRRVVMRESRYNPRARNHRYWGLMQISYPTAKSMGFRGTPEQLLNPVTNLTYAVPYLANAFIAAGRREDAAVRLYASGYYDTARRRGLLNTLRTADSAPATGFHEDPQPVVASAEPSFFGALFGAPAAPAQPGPDGVAPQLGQPAPAAVAAQASEPASTVRAGAPAAMPAKWHRDGGTTTLARGEQQTIHTSAAEGKPGRHTRKATAFASLDDVPATAQAYSGATSAVAPQTAINQAIAGQPAPGAADAAAGAVQADPAEAAAKPARKSAKHRVASRAAKATMKSAGKTEPSASGEAPAAMAELRR